MQMLYSYLTGNEFRQQIEAIVEAFSSMQSALNKEKIAMAKIWKEREKQIDKVIESTTGLYGSIKGIAGNAVIDIKALELDSDEELLLEEYQFAAANKFQNSKNKFQKGHCTISISHFNSSRV